jgi:hypothetical protein
LKKRHCKKLLVQNMRSTKKEHISYFQAFEENT